MPAPGLSLVGFMQQSQALSHLERDCRFPGATPEQLLVEWHNAQTQLGAPIPNAGKPTILPLPASADAHAQQVVGPGGILPGSSLNLVEIEPLLAYQFYIALDHSTRKCQGLSHPPTIS